LQVGVRLQFDGGRGKLSGDLVQFLGRDGHRARGDNLRVQTPPETDIQICPEEPHPVRAGFEKDVREDGERLLGLYDPLNRSEGIDEGIPINPDMHARSSLS
jgi:hypothetical protein